VLDGLLDKSPSSGGTPKFDRLTKTKTVEGLYPLVSETFLHQTFDLFIRLVQSSNTDTGEKKWAADQILILLRHHLVILNKKPHIIPLIIEFFCEYGFFLTEALKAPDQFMLREKLFSLLAILISDTKTVWASEAVLEIEKLEENNKRVVKLDSEIKKIRKQGLKTMKRLRATVHFLRTN
jgi:DNA polymerase phi